MNGQANLSIPPRLWAYLRLKPGDAAAAQAPELWAETLDAAKPATWREHLETVAFLELFAPHARASQRLMSRLNGCSNVWLLAATLGPGPENLVASHFRQNQPLAGYLTDRMANWLVELTMRQLAREAGQTNLLAGLAPRSWRYSPGYLDFSLEAQDAFFKHIPPSLNLTLGPGYILKPEKSITAVMGLIMP